MSSPSLCGHCGLNKYFTEDQIVELTLVVALANLTNGSNDALHVTPALG